MTDNLELVDIGTVKLDVSGAYIANDHLLGMENIISSSATPENSDPELDDDGSDGSIKSDDKINDKINGVVDGSLNGTVDSAIHGAITANHQPHDDDHEDEYDLTKNITLPQHNSEIIHISVDIGGSLTKLVYFTKSQKVNDGGKLHFKDFQTDNFPNEVLKFIIRLIRRSFNKSELPPITYIMATGGGSHKFYDLMTKRFIKNKLPMKIIAKDEMECLIKGLDWFITKIPNEIFIYDLQDNNIKFISSPYTKDNQIYPYLLVNIGSGVSMVKVVGPGPEGFERIGGSSLGGGTLWGLLSLLTDAKDYNEMLEMASNGNNENIDLLVGDIYGNNYNKIGLKSSHIASSFAKVFKKLSFTNKQLTPSEKLAQFKSEDIARSLLYSISNNIGQISYLHALKYDLKRIYFGGSYISGHKQTIHTLSYAVNFWSKGDMKSYFLRHEGYLGSVGAFMMGPNGPEMKQ